MKVNEYNRINELISEYSKISALLEKAEADIKMRQLKAAESLLPEHAELQLRLGDLEQKLRALADEHQAELFTEGGKRTHATPFGAMKFHRSSNLEFDDAEKVLLKIRLEADRADIIAAAFIRTHEEPNLEALETLDDKQLALFGVRRVTKDNFKVVPFAMKADKPKKEAA